MPSPYSRRPAPVGGRVRQGVLVLLTIALAALGLTAISSAAQADDPPRGTVATDGPAKFLAGVGPAAGPTPGNRPTTGDGGHRRTGQVLDGRGPRRRSDDSRDSRVSNGELRPSRA